MSTLSDTVRFMTIAVAVLSFIGLVFARGRATGNRSLRLVAVLVVLVAVLGLMTVTLVTTLPDKSGSF